MKATTSSSKAEITHNLAANLNGPGDGQGDTRDSQDIEAQARAGQETARQGKPESELRAAARRKGLNLKELAQLMGVRDRYLSQVGNGHRPWSPMMRERAMAVLGEVPGQGVVYRQGGVVYGGESTYIRERAREQGLTLRQVADRTGLTYSYVTQVSRGQRNLSPSAQVRMEAVLGAPVKIEAAQPAEIDPQSCGSAWTLMVGARTRWRGGRASARHALPGNERPAQALRDVLRRLHGVLFAPSPAELVAPVELKVMGWNKGGRNGVVVKGAGGPGAGGRADGGTIRVGGRVPWGAEVEFAYTTGYDSRGRVSVNHIVDERGCSAMLKQAGPDAV